VKKITMINTSKIRTAREKKGFSQEYMASKLNVSQPVYARMESGQKKIEAGLLFKIAKELEEPIQEFLDQNGNTFHIQTQTFEPHAAFIQHVYSEQKEF
jgi:transcriptional regulator with XRE-family HTH domain